MMKKIKNEFGQEFYADNNNNRWSADFYTAQLAEGAASTMIDCSDCLDCADCYNCHDCDGCRNSRNCSGSYLLDNCDNCHDCKELENCYDLCDESADTLNAKAAEVFGVDKADYYQSQEYTQMRMDGYSHEQIKDIIAERGDE